MGVLGRGAGVRKWPSCEEGRGVSVGRLLLCRVGCVPRVASVSCVVLVRGARVIVLGGGDTVGSGPSSNIRIQ